MAARVLLVTSARVECDCTPALIDTAANARYLLEAAALS